MSSTLKPRCLDVDLYAMGIGAAIALLSGFLLLQPLKQKSAQARIQQQDFQNQIQLAKQKYDQLRQMDSMQQQIARSLRNTENPLEKNHGIPKVLHDLQQIAQSCSLQLEEILPQSSESNAYYTQTRLALFLHGSSTSLQSYLTRIRKELEFVRVDTLSLENKNPAEPMNGEIHMELDVFSPKQ